MQFCKLILTFFSARLVNKILIFDILIFCNIYKTKNKPKYLYYYTLNMFISKLYLIKTIKYIFFLLLVFS